MEDWDVSLTIGNNISSKLLLVLLEQILETGSINKAVDAAGISYRSGWNLLNKAEEALGKKLILRQSGGQSGGGSALTSEGLRLLGHIQSLQRDIEGQLKSMIEQTSPTDEKKLMIASTTELIASGLLDVLIRNFFEETGISGYYISAGSGQALDMAKAGRVDMVLTHAPKLEEKFLEEGWGVERIPFMKDRFVLIGPASDPAQVAEASDIREAMKRIAHSKAMFITRGDRSGTHMKELELWLKSGVDPEGQIWYRSAQGLSGNTGVLHMADSEKAYALIDIVSFLTENRGREPVIVLDQGQELENIFSAIPISRKKAAVNQKGAERFARWLIQPKVQELIRGFGREQDHLSLFDPIETRGSQL